MKKILAVFAWLVTFPLAASHIVGGEFELLYLQGNTYRLNLIYYFDVLNGFRNAVGGPRLPESVDPNITARIYRKSDRQLMATYILPFKTKERVGYTQPECSHGEVVTDKLTYYIDVALSPEIYNHPEGYYVSWQRCCRNYTISNILSGDPDKQQVAAGQVFYLEFPPVVKNGQPFRNSSPHLFKPLNDYACPNKAYYVDFSGTDDDGDSLVYSLVTPMSTTATVALPAASPGPYPNVAWQQGFGLDRAVNGSPVLPSNPDLRISPDGQVTVTPKLLGIYVFAIKIEEYRNKQKIGESRRDFQLPVVDCEVSYPPSIVGEKLDAPGLTYKRDMSVSFAHTVPDEERCVVVRISDFDATLPTDNFSEFIRIRAIPLNFKNANLTSLLPSESTAIIHEDGFVDFRICFPKCPFFEGGPYQIGIIAYDDACALPLTDTLRIAVEVEPPPNARVEFVTGNFIQETLNEGEKRTWPFEARDADKDVLTFLQLTDGFLLEPAGMTVDVLSNDNGVLKGELTWDTRCDIFDFATRTNFLLTFMVDDADVCNINEADTAVYKLNVILPGNADPVVDTDLTDDPEEDEVKVDSHITESMSFKVTGKDLVDNDKITLRLAGEGFKPSTYGMSFQKVSGTGSANSDFSWNLVCDKFTDKSPPLLRLHFIAIDSTNKCRVRKADTVHVNLKLIKPTNTKPALAITSLNPNVSYSNDVMEFWMGQPVHLSIVLTDPDTPKDELRLDLIEAGGDQEPRGFAFTPLRGVSPQGTAFEWAPDCSIFTVDERRQEFFFRFRYGDNRCLTALADTVEIAVRIVDVPSGGFETEPPNVFTPNGDGHNDHYSMERVLDGTSANILPPDNCFEHFESVRICNRWGETVFESRDRNFKWFGDEESAGVYFYFIQFSNRQFKGTVSLRD